MGPADRHVRLIAALITLAGLSAFGLAILSDEFGVGTEGFGWKRITLLVVGVVAFCAGALLLARPRARFNQLTSRQARVAGMVVAVVFLLVWVVLAARQVAGAGFYSDDWNNLAVWEANGFFGAVSEHFHGLGSKPLLAVALAAPFEAFGADPAGHHVLAAALVLAAAGIFYLVLRELRFEARDAIPIALLALMFPWASGVRLWPAGSLNNLAVLLLFSGLLLALRGLRVGGRRGLLIHLLAAACYAASILAYDAVTLVALMLWPAYVWLHGWRAALPRAAMDILAVGAAAVYTAATTVKDVHSASEQLDHAVEILSEGARFLAASNFPVSVPEGYPVALTVAMLGIAFGVLAASLVRQSRRWDSPKSESSLRWATIAVVALAVLVLSWAIYVPGAAFTPSQPGTEDRVNIIALYPAVVFVYAVLRAAGSLVSPRGYVIAVAACVLIAIGYVVHDFRQESDWIAASEAQERVLESIELASPPSGALVLTFGHPAQSGPRVPVFNQTYDLYPAARLRTGSEIQTYPVFEGAQLECLATGIRMNLLPTPHYETIEFEARGTPRRYSYPWVVFVDVAQRRDEVIRSREQCEDALGEFTPGPLASPSS